jgi:hypothetical protein
VGVQRRHHALQRRLDQLLGVGLHNIAALDDGDDVAEQLQHPVGLGGLGPDPGLADRDGTRTDGQGRDAEQGQFTHGGAFETHGEIVSRARGTTPKRQICGDI